MGFIKKYYTPLLVVFCTVFAMQMWLCSGTLAPYAATLVNPHLINDQGDYVSIPADTNLASLNCYYIANYDHKHYIANYDLMRGKPREEWNWAHLLHRPLLYILSYPLMRMFGFTGGGFICALLLNIAMLVWFTQWVKKRWGHTAAFAGLLLLCAYPASMYWSGQPYPHILITASTLLLCILLYKVYETQNVLKIALLSLLAGISYLAYDTYSFFIPAFGLLLLVQKKWVALPISIVLQVLPLALWVLYLSDKLQPAADGNTGIYFNVINAYLNATPQTIWENLLKLPGLLVGIVARATYYYIGGFFLLIIIFGIITRTLKPQLPFWCIVIAMFTVFVFNNMAPPYPGWQMRGTWIARIYQPVIIICLLATFYFIKNLEEKGYNWLKKITVAAALVVFAFNTRINISPALGDDSLTHYHYGFYYHADPKTMHDNLEKNGRRPFMVCPQ